MHRTTLVKTSNDGDMQEEILRWEIETLNCVLFLMFLFLGSLGPGRTVHRFYGVFHLPQTLVKNLAKYLVKNLTMKNKKTQGSRTKKCEFLSYFSTVETIRFSMLFNNCFYAFEVYTVSWKVFIGRLARPWKDVLMAFPLLFSSDVHWNFLGESNRNRR